MIQRVSRFELTPEILGSPQSKINNLAGIHRKIKFDIWKNATTGTP